MEFQNLQKFFKKTLNQKSWAQFLKKSKIPAWAPLGGLLEDAHAGILDFFENCAQDFWFNVFGYFQLSSNFFKKLPLTFFKNIFQKLFWTDN